MKKSLFLTLAFILLFASNAFASGLAFEYYPPSDSDFYMKKFTQGFFISSGVAAIRFTQFTDVYDGSGNNTELSHITFSVKPNTTIYFDETCKQSMSYEFLDSSGSVLDFGSRGNADSYISSTSCSKSAFVIPSDYDTTTNKYKNDMFGGTRSISANPPTGYTGSGGSSDQPVIGVIDSTVSISDGNTEARSIGFPVSNSGSSGSGSSGSSGGSSGGSATTDDVVNAVKDNGSKLNDLKAALQEISSALATTNSKLSDTNNLLTQIGNSVNSNGTILSNILGELITNDSVITGSVPSVPVIDQSGRLERNKPSENPVFKDDSTHFSDQGDSTDVPSDMPIVPDVKDWDGYTKAADGSAESELFKDGEMTKDSMAADNTLTKSNELSKDSMAADGELSKDGEMIKDSMAADGQLSKDGEMTKDSMAADDQLSKDSEFTKDGSLSRTNFYTQDNELTVSE